MPEIIVVRPGQTVELSPLSPGFAHGFGLFETMHYAEGRLSAWSDHWRRLRHSATTFGIAVPQESQVLQALKTLVEAADVEEGALKLSLLRGTTDTQLFVYLRPPLPKAAGRKLWIDADAPIFERSPLAGHKTHNYMEAIHGMESARARGYYDSIRFDSRGRLAETNTANVFFIRGGRVCTPAVDTGILPGVTRSILLRIPDLKPEVGHYDLEHLKTAEALFLTNAFHGLVPMERLEGLPGGGGLDFDTAHPSLKKIQAAYTQARSSVRLR